MNDYIGLPFSETDNGRAGTHCWGLVRMVFAELRGIALPAYGDMSAVDLMAVARLMTTETGRVWREIVSAPRRPFDVLLMAGRVDGARRPVHCGVMVDERRVLHVERATAAVVVPLTHLTIRHRILSTWRHEALS